MKNARITSISTTTTVNFPDTKRIKRSYTPDFKQKVVLYIKQHGICNALIKYDVPKTTAKGWEYAYDRAVEELNSYKNVSAENILLDAQSNIELKNKIKEQLKVAVAGILNQIISTL